MKKITTLFLMLFVFIGLQAQTTIKVQGISRELSRTVTPRATSDEVMPGISFDNILYWVGEGDKKSALVVKWDDFEGNTRLLVWGYRWTTAKEGTGEARLLAVAKADPRFYLLALGSQYGLAFGGMAFDANGDGNTAWVKENKRYELADGIYYTSGYDFDSYTVADKSDLCNAGWNTAYWSYWTAGDIHTAYEYAQTGASSRVLEEGSIDGWAFFPFDAFGQNAMDGVPEYVTAPAVVADYTKGLFFINEGWYGHENSTVNFLSEGGEWTYRVFQKENPGMELGATSQFGTIYGDKFYVVAKQSKDPGASIAGGRFTVCDAKTLKCLKQWEFISKDDKGNSNADGRAFLGVDEHKGYISTSNGIYVYDIDRMEISGKVTGSDNPEDEGYGSLYRGQVGTMLRVNDYVFAVHQSTGILVINPETDAITKTIAGPAGWGYGSVVLSKDGNLWASVANTSGSGVAAPFIYKIDPATCDTTRVNMPEGIYSPANSWYAWTPDCFCASKQNNVLYWNGGKSSWFSNSAIYKYDIDNNRFGQFIDLSTDTDKWLIYGCSFRIDPVTDNAYVSLYHSFGDNTYIARTYNNKGEKLQDYSMISNYWFPSLPVFPDNAAPVLTTLGKQTLDSQDPYVISLTTLATDADNMESAIVKNVKSVSDETVLKAAIVAGDLKISPQGKTGDADVTVKVNSNGKLTETVVAVTITSDGTGIDEERLLVRSAYSHGNQLFVTNCEGYEFVLYSVSGSQEASFRADNNNFSISINVPSGIYLLKGNADNQHIAIKVVVNP